jgi:hypothetical protein
LAQRLAEIGRERLTKPLAAGEWSPHQVLAHVEAVDSQALQPRLLRIVEEERPNLPNWDEGHWMKDDYEGTEPVEDFLTRLGEGRERVLQPLAELPLTEWNRSGIHPLWGERTLLWWLEYSVHHTEEHLHQLGSGSAQIGDEEA